jgi:hemolysin activation/secretion protein
MCNYKIIVGDDGKTFILKPNNPFQFGEKVNVQFTNSIKTTSGKSINTFSYSFTIKEREVKVNHQAGLEFELEPEIFSQTGNNTDFIEGFPNIALNYYNNHPAGYPD